MVVQMHPHVAEPVAQLALVATAHARRMLPILRQSILINLVKLAVAGRRANGGNARLRVKLSRQLPGYVMRYGD